MVLPMKNIILALVLLIIVAAIVFYLYRTKKRGQTCIGCPYAKQCGGKCAGGCGCNQGHDGQ